MRILGSPWSHRLATDVSNRLLSTVEPNSFFLANLIRDLSKSSFSRLSPDSHRTQYFHADSWQPLESQTG